jgi:uncharacterized protein DUF6596
VNADTQTAPPGIRAPHASALPDAVLRVIYLVFTEGHKASTGTSLVRGELCDTAIRLARTLAALLADEPEVAGLLSLLLLTDARRAARVDAAGALVLLDDQDRQLWDEAMITGETLSSNTPYAPDDPARTNSTRQSRRAIPPPGTRSTPIGDRSPCCTANSSDTSRPRSSKQTGPSRSPWPTAPQPDSSFSTL